MYYQEAILSVLLFLFLKPAIATHYRGGIITWRALNTTPPTTGNVQIMIRQRHAWRRGFFNPQCNDARIAAQNLVGSGTGSLVCYAGGACPSYTSVTADVICTDFSADPLLDYSAGERVSIISLPLNRSFTVGFYGVNWMALAMRGNGIWQITGKIDLTVRPDGIINTSPVTSTLPVIYRTVHTRHVHVIQMSDANSLDTLRCRWSTNNVAGGVNWNGYDECGSVCHPTLPSGTVLFPDNCTLVFQLNATSYFAVALQIEDFYTPTSPTPMSSVPIQFLFLGRNPPGGCSTAPIITGVRPNLACIGTPANILTNETVIAQVGCSGKSIVEFVTSSPIGLRKTAIINLSPGVFAIVLTWTPTTAQFGPQGFCAGAIDNTGVQSNPWCITFLVGFTAPNLQKPMFVQHSASPLGTILSNHNIFSIQSANGVGVNRPGRNGTFVHFNDATLNGTRVLSYDCGWSTNVIYSGSTIIINTAPFLWTHGHHYYVTFDSGASSGVDFCRAESEPLTDPAFWRFNIWDPQLSSTTPNTTTTPTQIVPIVTTRGPSTTTPLANLTTTGIATTTPTSPTGSTTTTITTTTRTTTTTATTISTTSTLPPVKVISPKEYEEACRQPLIVGTVISMACMVPINIFGMFTLFTKIEKMFNPNHLKVAQRQMRNQRKKAAFT